MIMSLLMEREFLLYLAETIQNEVSSSCEQYIEHCTCRHRLCVHSGKKLPRSEEAPLRIAFIGCMVMFREVSALMAKSEHVFRPFWMPQGLHDTPEQLTASVQAAIDEVEEINARAPEHLRFDAIVLGYGLCSNGTVGLKTQTLPLVIPRCDDCISLFLGSRARYLEEFRKVTGTFWYARGWVEQSDLPGPDFFERQRQKFMETYEDEELVDYLCEAEQSWVKNYTRAAYILSPLGDSEEDRAKVRRDAETMGWRYEELPGDGGFLQKLAAADWDEEYFFTCPPGREVKADHTGKLFTVD